MRRFSAICQRPARLVWAAGALLVWLAGVTGVLGQPARLEFKPLQMDSRSRQFKVIGHLAGTPLGPPSLSLILSNHVQLEPTVLVLTCERVRMELLGELGLGDGWMGRIEITVRGDLPPTAPVVVDSQWFPGGWRYRLLLPGQIERARLMRALTRALLLEIANRNNPSQRLAEIPLWLEEGLATHLLALHGDTLVPEVRTRLAVIRSASPDAFLETRQRLRGRRLVAFSELCLARSDQFSDQEWEVFRRSAQLLVAELLNLPEGRAAMPEFLRQLPGYLNSQLAFLRAFGARFPAMLDAEKWWAVVWMNFTARDRHMRDSLAHSLGQLEEVLAAPIAVRLGAGAVPGRKELPLREVIAHTDFSRHQFAVSQAALQLQLLQVSAPVELARLIADYRAALSHYLKRRFAYSSKSTSTSADAKLATKEVLEKLDLLDVIRGDFHQLDAAAGSDSPAGPE